MKGTNIFVIFGVLIFTVGWGACTPESLETKVLVKKVVKPVVLPPNTVSIYLSVGRKATGRCWRGDVSSCNLYKVEWALPTNQALSTSQVTNASGGEYFPALSPDGSKISFEHQVGTSKGKIAVMKASGGTISYVTSSGTTAPASGRYANWKSDTQLLFQKTAHGDSYAVNEYSEPFEHFPRWKNIFLSTIQTSSSGDPSVNLLNLGASISGAYKLFPIFLGDVFSSTFLSVTVDTTDFSFGDVFTNPANRDQIAAHSKDRLICSDGVLTAGECEVVPRVIDMTLTSMPISQRITHFDLTVDATRSLTSCAHLAFSPNGEKVLCTEQHSYFNDYVGTYGASSTQDLIYGFKYDSTSGKYVLAPGVTSDTTSFDYGALFKHKTPAELETLNAGFIQYKPDQAGNPPTNYCKTYVHKYAEFCGSSKKIVATVHCLDYDQVTTLHSRVYLIDISDPENPSYHDLTRVVEIAEGRTENMMTGWTATCSSPYHTSGIPSGDGTPGGND